MSDVKETMMREPHPFVNAKYMETMAGKTVALMGKVEKVEAACFTVRTSDGKFFCIASQHVYRPERASSLSSLYHRGALLMSVCD